MKIWIDADACPRVIRDIVFRASKRLRIPVCLVADREMSTPETSLITAVCVGQEFNEADDYIVESRWNDKTIWQGPAIALRVTSRLSLGIAGFHGYRKVDWASEVRQVGPRDDDLLTDYLDHQRARIERSVHSLIFKAGARYELTRQWKIGLAVTSPSVTIWGGGSVHTDPRKAGYRR